MTTSTTTFRPAWLQLRSGKVFHPSCHQEATNAADSAYRGQIVEVERTAWKRGTKCAWCGGETARRMPSGEPTRKSPVRRAGAGRGTVAATPEAAAAARAARAVARALRTYLKLRTHSATVGALRELLEATRGIVVEDFADARASNQARDLAQASATDVRAWADDWERWASVVEETGRAPDPLRSGGGGARGGGAVFGVGLLPQNSLERYPSGRWGFVGSVDARLGYVKEDGSLLDLRKDAEQIRLAGEFGPRLARVQKRTFATAYDAMTAAKEIDQSVNVPLWMLDRHPELSAALKRSKVKSVIR